MQAKLPKNVRYSQEVFRMAFFSRFQTEIISYSLAKKNKLNKLWNDWLERYEGKEENGIEIETCFNGRSFSIGCWNENLFRFF